MVDPAGKGCIDQSGPSLRFELPFGLKGESSRQKLDVPIVPIARTRKASSVALRLLNYLRHSSVGTHSITYLIKTVVDVFNVSGFQS